MHNKLIYNILGLILYRVLLDFNYIFIIEPVFNYAGFLNQSSPQSIIISYFALFLLVPLVLPIFKSERISANIIVMLFLVSYVPMTSLMRFMPLEPRFLMLYLAYWWFLLSFYYLIPSFNFPNTQSKRSESILWLLLIVFIGTIIYVSGRYMNFRLHFNLSDVYSLRAEERALNLPLLLRYLLPAAENILSVLLVYFLYQKKWIITIIIGFVILLYFSIGGNKSAVFKLVLCFLGFWFFKLNRIYLYSWILTFVSFLSLLENKIISTISIADIGIRRVLFLPSLLNYNYYDYFSKNEPDYLRQGILRWFGFSSPYKDPIPRIIGNQYFNYGSIETNANNGLFSEAISNFKILGVLLFPLILIVIFKLFDTCSKELDPKLLILPMIICTITFISASFSTALLTNGILTLMITLYFMPRYKKA